MVVCEKEDIEWSRTLTLDYEDKWSSSVPDPPYSLYFL
jgi:hypothetical protein